ncbi:hypothetical protein FRB96_001317 [Tulasnella sp. 330]|nr:hypothetical protein FRB96_001317 [Tulasnella sp. 330]
MSDQMSPVEHITFEGRKNESVTLFLQNVKRIAFAEGRQRDQEWLADYVETCLAEKALEWYIALDQKIRYDFDALRVAMVERFRVVTPANLPPAPAAAAPPFTAPTLSTPSSSKPKPSQKRLGRITIVRQDGILPGYCSSERFEENSKRWQCDRTALASDALVVELCTPSDSSKASQSLLKVVSADGTINKGFLGAASFVSAMGSKKAAWILCFCEEGIIKPYPRARSPKNPDKESASRIWQLSEDTLELNINWEASGKGILTLELRANKEDTRNMWMRSAEDPDLEPSSKAKLYFEPL